MELASQIFGALGVVATIIIYQQKKRSRLLTFKLISDFLWGLHYVFLGAYTGAAICVIAALREIISMNREKHRWARTVAWPTLFVILAIASSVLTWQGPASILATVSSVVSVISFWIGNPRLTRKLVFINSSSMLTYDVLFLSYMGIVNELFGLTSAIIGIIRLDVKKRRFEKGMTSVTFRQKSIDDVVKIAKKAGLSFIEWGGDVHVKPGDFDAAASAVKLMTENGLHCPAYGSYYRVGDGDMDGFDLICRTAAALGAARVRVWLGRKGSDETTAEERDALIKETRALADIAENYSLDVAFEFHGKTLNDNGKTSREFLIDCDRKNVKTYWQPLAFGDSEENLKEIADKVAAVHVFYWDKQNNRYPLSDGTDEWKRYAAILEAAPKPVQMTLEFVAGDSDEQFLADAKTLGDLIK